MLRTARGFKLTDQPRITDFRYCLNTDTRGMFTYASLEAFVNCIYNTDLRYCLYTQNGQRSYLREERSVGYDPEHCSPWEIGKADVGRRAYTMRVLVYSISAPLCKE